MQITLLPQNGYFTTARKIFADTIFPEGKELRNKAERAANTDKLTGLASRRALDLALPTAEADKGTAVILFDANNFKFVNKVLSHTTGDGVLKNMAEVIKLAASRYKLAERVFRYGGDEFVILCPVELAEELRAVVERMYVPFILPDGTAVSISGTVGSTINEADQTLQARKKSHKNAK